MTILFTANHKVDDVVYVVDNCVRRGIVQQVDFTHQDSVTIPFLLSYEVLYDGFSFNTTIISGVNFNVTGSSVGSPDVGSPTASAFGSPLPSSLTVTEKLNGGGIYDGNDAGKDAALAAFGETLA